MVRTIFLLLFIVAGTIYALRELTALQQNNYYFSLNYQEKERNRNINETFIISLLSGIAIIVGAFSELSAYIITIVILVGMSGYCFAEYSGLRTKYKLTPRGTRLLLGVFVALSVLSSIASIFITILYLRLASLFILLISARLIAVGVNYLIRPLEILNNNRYIKAAKARLDAMDIVKIGITGSFGKTSCKNILATILSKKYKVLKTEGNYNTPMGITLSLRELNEYTEVFIAEMGAKRKGDIKELAEIVRPKYAIITGTTAQHLASFKNEENIFVTKKELIDSLPIDGYAVFNGDNIGSLRMSKLCKIEYTLAHTEKKEGVYAQNIKLTNAGSSFEIMGLGEPLKVSTCLLGRHNILNILMCVSLAVKMEVPKADIVEAVKELKPIPHRLELVDNKRNITIIDDSYNANIEGAFFALEVISQFKGRKVVFSQGIVELGYKQDTINEDLGALISKVADIVILMGENESSIEKGLKRSGYEGEIYHYNSMLEVQNAFITLLKAGDVLLIQNDIP